VGDFIDVDEFVYDLYVVIFDYSVPVGEENPDAVQLFVDEQLKFTRHQGKSRKERINYTVKEIPGMPEDYYGRQS
jgi:hypothetical protein